MPVLQPYLLLLNLHGDIPLLAIFSLSLSLSVEVVKWICRTRLEQATKSFQQSSSVVRAIVRDLEGSKQSAELLDLLKQLQLREQAKLKFTLIQQVPFLTDTSRSSRTAFPKSGKEHLQRGLSAGSSKCCLRGEVLLATAWQSRHRNKR